MPLKLPFDPLRDVAAADKDYDGLAGVFCGGLEEGRELVQHPGIASAVESDLKNAARSAIEGAKRSPFSFMTS